MRIAQVANFWTPTSGGLRVVLDRLARGYAAAGHEVVLVVPGERDAVVDRPWGVQVSIASPRVPGAGGYRTITRPHAVRRVFERFRPTSIELSDRTTLARLAGAARADGARAVLVGHERIDGILARRLPGRTTATRLADRWNPRTARHVDAVVVPSPWAALEWERVGVAATIVPWGVDLDHFRPKAPERLRSRPEVDARGVAERDRGLRAGEVSVVWVGRLSAEKRPALAVEVARALRAGGSEARLTVVGDGPEGARLRRQAADLDVVFTGHLDTAAVAAALRGADVTLSTSGVETFGLSVLESLASGTPVVAVEGGAAGWVAGDCGLTVPPLARDLAAAVERIVTDPPSPLRCRTRAEGFSWSRAVDAMLAVHADLPSALVPA